MAAAHRDLAPAPSGLQCGPRPPGAPMRRSASGREEAQRGVASWPRNSAQPRTARRTPARGCSTASALRVSVRPTGLGSACARPSSIDRLSAGRLRQVPGAVGAGGGGEQSWFLGDQGWNSRHLVAVPSGFGWALLPCASPHLAGGRSPFLRGLSDPGDAETDEEGPCSVLFCVKGTFAAQRVWLRG